MARLRFHIESELEPKQIREALLDFTPRRPELWPGLDPAEYKVYEIGDTWAEIREGNGGRIWARERYDWSDPGRVIWTVVQSGFSKPGDSVDVKISSRPEGGSRLDVAWERRGSNLMGKFVVGLIWLTRGMPVSRQMKAGFQHIAKQSKSEGGAG